MVVLCSSWIEGTVPSIQEETKKVLETKKKKMQKARKVVSKDQQKIAKARESSQKRRQKLFNHELTQALQSKKTDTSVKPH